MLNEKITKLLNEQINKELYSGYLYLDMANYYADQGFEWVWKLVLCSSAREQSHAMLIRQYLLNNGEAVVFTPIDAPDEKYSDFKEPLTKALEHERYVTDLINKIYEAAEGIKDYRTIKFLDWFIQEQGEEEKNAEDNIRKYELFANDSKGLYLLDNEMKARVYVAPSLVMD